MANDGKVTPFVADTRFLLRCGVMHRDGEKSTLNVSLMFIAKDHSSSCVADKPNRDSAFLMPVLSQALYVPGAAVCFFPNF